MILTYHHATSIKAQQGSLTLAFDPVSKDSKNFKPARFGADIVCVSTQHADMDGVASVSRGENEPFVITGPGEYEVHDVSILGFPGMTEYSGEKHVSAIYRATIDGMHVVHLGALSELPTQEVKEELGEVDILCVPIGGGGVLNAAAAHKLAVQLEAQVIIPTLYDDKSLKAFLKEAGSSTAKPQEKLTIKRKELASMSGEVVVLKAS